jgi:hypothetical protein
MEADPVNRRHLLARGATGAAVATTAVLAGSPAVSATDGADGLVGAWRLDRSDPSIGNTSYGYWTFSPGGVVHYQDIYPLNALLHGAWRSSRRQFEFTMWGGLPDPVTGGPITALVAGTGSWGRGDALSTDYTVTFFDPVTEAPLFSYDGTGVGTRLVL